MNSFHKEIANNMLGTDDTSHHTAYHCPLILKDSLEYHRVSAFNYHSYYINYNVKNISRPQFRIGVNMCITIYTKYF